MKQIAEHIAKELSVNSRQVTAAIELLDEGATVPFIARYRKEHTGGLDDSQLRHLEERLQYLRDMHKRRESIINTIKEQGKLTAALEQALNAAQSKTELEDLYLPYKPKRRTKAQIAREAGLEPLANQLLQDFSLDPQQVAANFIDASKGIEDAAQALDGARQILMEQFAENAALMGACRELMWSQGILSARVVSGKEEEGKKFSDYFDYREQISKVPSHRALALFRGRNENILLLDLDLDAAEGQPHSCELLIAKEYGIHDNGRAADKWLLETVRWAWKIKLHTRLDVDLKMRLREQAEEEAIHVFSTNLKDLLLAAPAGAKTTMGLDPGIRTGVKVAVVDATGKLLDTATIYPHQPRNQWDQSIETLQALIVKHKVELISIGNGTASRETDKLCADLLKRYPNKHLATLVISEAGASVYSASELAAREFPGLDVSLRGAVSIARRLQDPLAELVKIEPKAIGVGQYQHDVNQPQLSRSLDAVVEDCVNAVGVDLNMASAPLLSHVAGLNTGLAENIVAFRDENGAFNNRKQLLKVPRLGPKAFEQSAGFLRIADGDDPLDASAVHPEAASVVQAISRQNNMAIAEMIGNSAFLGKLKPQDYTSEQFGLPTVRDILAELDKPGRDPRPEFVTASFREGVDDIKDLHEGMELEGVVTNVTNFGAFVDIGVHQDGLVHISQLADRFVKDPRDVVKTGDVVKVRVQEVDVARKRIGLTMRLKGSTDAGKSETASKGKAGGKQQSRKPKKENFAGNSIMAAAFKNAK